MSNARRSEPPPDGDPPIVSFEASLERLESIVAKLERGDLELEVALTAFEEGVSLARGCADQLGRAERRVEVLVRDGEGWAIRPFEESQENE